MYTYTSSNQHLHFIWKVDELEEATERMNRNQQVKKQLETKFPTYHSRGMRKELLCKFGRVTKTRCAFLREMYRTLVGDASSSTTQSAEETDKRVRYIFRYRRYRSSH